ncbi:Bug family tripartite tricarboxylate transporter substrate binding protein [Ottowia sp.]|uniref:Bug family tripartite tricarboxylate transporter substrate binding protein n=1 Tax=Ottowia sp. TaxID=1898956 RepID=UPI0039E5FDB5
MKPTRRTLLLAAAAMPLTLPLAGRAEGYPSKVVRVIVPYPAGSSLDLAARIFSESFPKQFGQPAIVVNQPGAAGTIGTRATAKAEADGYTLMLGTNQTHGANSALMPNLGYDALADFAPIAGIARLQHVLVVRKSLGVSTLAEFIALARKPGQQINYGSSGNGSASHLAAEMFKMATGVPMAHIPYNGSSQVAQALMGSQIDATFSTLPSVLGFIKSGGIVALAMASKDRAPQLPEVKTLAEQGVANSEADAWTAFFAPAKTPAPVLATLTDFALKTFKTPEVREKLEAAGFAPDVTPGTAFRAFLAQDMKRWATVVRQANVKLE